MAQTPMLVDGIQIEPGSAGTRTITRDATAGALKFVDPLLTSGVTLSQLVGLRNITGVFLVGRAGDGAPYTTIQDALDAVPDSSTSLLPSVILICPGVYQENLIIEKDGVSLIGLGRVQILNDGAFDTITVRASQTVTPLNLTLKGLEVKNSSNAKSCVDIDGSDTFATGTVTVVTAPLVAGDKVTIGGVALTGVGATRTPGSNDFSVLGGTTDTIAAEIAAAINDELNDFTDLVSADPLLAVVTLTAINAGTVGNAITLVPLTTPVGGLTVSAATLLGGSAAGSLVGSEGILLEGCTLLSAGVGGFQVSASTINSLEIRGGTFRGSASTSSLVAANCASLLVSGVDWINDLTLTYNDGNDVPDTVTSEYVFSGCSRINEVAATFTGVVGGLTLWSCGLSDMVLAGQTLLASSSYLGTLSLDDIAVSLVNTPHGALTNAGGSPTLAETVSEGTKGFVASVSETVTFTIPQPDTSYRVSLESPSSAVTLAVANKLAASFDIVSSGALTGTVGYVVSRSI